MRTLIRQLVVLSGIVFMPAIAFGQDTNPEQEIKISPSDTTVSVGAVFQFTAVFTSDGTAVDTTFSWEVSDSTLASIDADGNFLAKADGEVEVIARVDSVFATTEVSIQTEQENEEGNEEELFRVIPSDTTIFVGEFLVLKAQYRANEVWIDTTATFELNNNELAQLENGDTLFAARVGNVEVTATLDTLSVVAKIDIREKDEDDDAIVEELILTPVDTLVGLDSEIVFQAFNSLTMGNVTDSVTWSIAQGVGSIDSTGKALFSTVGFSLVKAEFNGLKGSASVRVQDLTEDTTGVQIIEVYIPRNNPNVRPAKHVISEGEVLRLSGFASPLNYLNGGTVYFPLGSLTEDIVINVSREDYTGTTEDGKRIVGGIGFDVFVQDTLVSPYEFEKPIEISIPFKRGLLNNLGIDVNNLSMFNMEDDGGLDTVGVSSVVIDSAGGRIFGYVSHFSKYVLSPKEDVLTTSADDEATIIPEGITLGQNYPNPFNPTTRIAISLDASANVDLAVYDMLGRKVATVVQTKLTSGSHTFEFNGTSLASGLYVYQLKVNGISVATKMMTLLK